ncbi:MAG: hypothetical protein Q9209_002747 [Squamulea sp. 1 TL-2023]
MSTTNIQTPNEASLDNGPKEIYRLTERYKAWLKDIHEESELEKIFNELSSKGEEIEAAAKGSVNQDVLSNLKCEYQALDKLLTKRLRDLCGLINLRGLRKIPFSKDRSPLGQEKMNAEYQLEKVLIRVNAFLEEYDNLTQLDIHPDVRKEVLWLKLEGNRLKEFSAESKTDWHLEDWQELNGSIKAYNENMYYTKRLVDLVPEARKILIEVMWAAN